MCMVYLTIINIITYYHSYTFCLTSQFLILLGLLEWFLQARCRILITILVITCIIILIIIIYNFKI